MSQGPLDVEEAFNRHKNIVPQVRQAYEQAITDIFADLSAKELEPFAEILVQQDNTCLDTATIIEQLKNRMTGILCRLNQQFFDINGVDNKLITLEVLKEKFACHQGKNWNVYNIAPEDYTRPVRMRLIDSSIRFMERQLESQQSQLELALTKCHENRQILQNLQNERVKLKAIMEEQSSVFDEAKPILLELDNQMIDLI
ncbi:uncharacterized protein Dwil_GK21831 [Drosophila willistoni]|uniref:GK21831 n=1 Tax=Drosophila willistoni TaxID=7260 RepID=B4MQ65_DROWI|nr:uncharacterized protein LOC6640445 [Drosophila willistoni]EDW74254.1 uncharacterized protein Dwil_GK21831 [Drosophila willistoni]